MRSAGGGGAAATPIQVRAAPRGRERAGALSLIATASARLDLVESLGNETYIYASAGRHDVTARVSPQSLPPLGSKIYLAFDLEKAHFFDSIGGERIG